MSNLKLKRIVITGACGAVGSALVQNLIENDNTVIGLFDNNEEKLFWLSKKFANHRNYQKLRFQLGDLRDENRLIKAFYGADVIFHTAALKHVKLNELNPFEIVKTNVIGVQNVINAALENKVEKVIFASSDKAVNPTSSMGASKLLGERLFIAANSFTGEQKTSFCCVRFGNIINSSGSVIPIFRQQLSNAEPLTITDVGMTRFLITMDSAIDLLLFSEETMIGGEIFIASMGAANILDIAKALNNGEMPNYNTIGIQSGEKLYEELITESELRRAYNIASYVVVLPDLFEGSAVKNQKKFSEKYKKQLKSDYSLRSDRQLLSSKDVAKLVI